MPHLAPKSIQPEKILLAGEGGTGKTTAVLDVARRALGPGQTMEIVDTEGHVAVLLEAAGFTPREIWWGDEKVEENTGSDVSLPGGGSIVLRWTREWEEHRAIKTAMEARNRGDWVVVDSISHPWSDVQAWWISQCSKGEEFGDWVTRVVGEGREAGRRDEGAGEMLREWKVINAQWNSYVAKPLLRARAHVVLTAHIKTINPEHDSKAVKGLWGPFRAKADTQKQIPYQVRTVIGMDKRQVGRDITWTGLVLKDQGRDLGEFDVKGFGMDYLKGRGKWEVQK